MTPDQLEHLKLIDAHLEHLLAIAEKRTAGEWFAGAAIIGNGVDSTICEMPSSERDYPMWQNNIHFIASCAGNAEAGWRATRAAIKALLEINKFLNSGSNNDNFTVGTATLIQKALLPHILAAFPLELIQKP